jgi:hypothetical protein
MIRKERLITKAGVLSILSFLAVSFSVSPAVDTELTDKEVEGIKLMWQEEKLARDTYLFFKEKYNHRAFDNISSSEQRHMDALAGLLDNFGHVTENPVREMGKFSNPRFQALYDSLTVQGSSSLSDAFRMGALIEEMDILDIQRELAQHVRNVDVKFTYEQLMRGSRNHLRAFTGNLSRQGIDYVPQLMEIASYKKITDGAWEQGNHGKHGKQSNRGSCGIKLVSKEI